MTKILAFQKNTQNEQNRIVLLPQVFTKLLELYKQHQNKIKNRKIEFLTQQAFQYYYDHLLMTETETAGVNFPDFILIKQAEQRRCTIANQLAAQIMLQVIADNRVDECYSKRIKQLKSQKRTVRK